MSRIVFMARDPGPAAALAPVARRLIDDGRIGVSVLGRQKATAAFEAERLAVVAAPEGGGAAAALAREDAALLVTGTSSEVANDAAYWQAARDAGIPSVALLDHWRNYPERFSVESPFDVTPDVIAVMDDAARTGMEQAGCPADRIRVTGQPYFDPGARKGVVVDRAQARRELGVDEDRPLVVFVSEPKIAYPGSSDSGYTEFDAFAVLQEAVEGMDVQLLVKLHPYDDPDEFLARVDGRPRAISAYSPWRLVAAADAVVGMTSILLLQAAVMGRPSISLRPGGGSDPFIELHADRIASAPDATAIRVALADALSRSAESAPDVPAFADRAIERTCALLYELANSSASRP